jgi:hypothetical protein
MIYNSADVGGADETPVVQIELIAFDRPAMHHVEYVK